MAPKPPRPAGPALLEKARGLYAAERFDQAAAAFKEVVDACPCGQPLRRSSCLCKDLLRSIGEGQLKDALKKPCICSAKSDKRCPHEIHLASLNALATLAEKAEDLDRCLLIAQQMVELHPRDPKGYLRLGKALRLRGSADIAIATYQQGRDLVAQKSPNNALLPKLDEQRLKVKSLMRSDPFHKLPFELIRIIFQYTGFRATCQCLRVSKTWKYMLSCRDASELWRSLEFAASKRRPPSSTALMRYVAFADKKVASVCVHECQPSGFDLNMQKLSILLGKQLKSLKLRGAHQASAGTERRKYLPPAPAFVYPSLQSLYLGPDINLPLGLIRDLVQSSPDLEHLSLLNVTSSPTFGDEHWPNLGKLRSLEVAGDLRNLLRAVHAYDDEKVRDAEKASRNLERIWIENVPDGITASFKQWPNLRHLCVRNDSAYSRNASSSVMASPGLGELYLQDIRLVSEAVSEPDLTEQFKFRCFSYQFRTAEDMQFYSTFLEDSFRSETIQELYLSPFPFSLFRAEGTPAWFQGPSLKSLGLTGLNAATGFGMGSPDDTLVELVRRFPNLETLDISNEVVQPTTLGKVVEKTSIRTIYHQSGLLMSELQTWAASKYGARVIDAPGPSPHQHPDSPLNLRKQQRGVKRPQRALARLNHLA